ncbi:MAG: porin [Bacteroidota bacterium]
MTPTTGTIARGKLSPTPRASRMVTVFALIGTAAARAAGVAALLVLAAVPAQAQIGASPAAPSISEGGVANPTPASPAAGAAAPPADAPPPAVPAASSDVVSRLDELDQIARIASRKHELLEEEAAKRAKEAAVTTVDEKGLVVKSGDGAYVLKIRALLQIDGRFFLDDDALQDRDTILIRKFRPTIEGTLFGLVDYRFTPDFAGGVAQVFDAYVDVHPAPWLRLRLGKAKAPLGLERLQGDQDLPFIERALDQNLTTAREVGALLWGDIAGGIVNYTVGIVNGGPDGTQLDVDTNHAKDFVGRVFFQPFKAEGLRELGELGVGIAGSTGNRKGLPQVGTTAATPGLPSFRTFGQNTFFSYLAPAADPAGTGTVFAHLRSSRINPQLYYYNGPIGLQGEYVWARQSVQKGNDTATFTHHAAHGTASFVINGKNGYDGVTPAVPFDLAKGALGALEIAARYAWLKVDLDTFPFPAATGVPSFADPLRSARVAQSFAGAINYVPRRSFRLSLDFEQTRFTGGAAGAAVATGPRPIVDRKTENVIGASAQVHF